LLDRVNAPLESRTDPVNILLDESDMRTTRINCLEQFNVVVLVISSFVLSDCPVHSVIVIIVIVIIIQVNN